MFRNAFKFNNKLCGKHPTWRSPTTQNHRLTLSGVIDRWVPLQSPAARCYLPSTQRSLPAIGATFHWRTAVSTGVVLSSTDPLQSLSLVLVPPPRCSFRGLNTTRVNDTEKMVAPSRRLCEGGLERRPRATWRRSGADRRRPCERPQPAS